MGCRSKCVYAIAKLAIKLVAGKIQISRVIKAKENPPLLKAINTTVWVEEAPGNNWQKALYSINSSAVMSFLFSTNRCCNRPKCTCGPPNAVKLWVKTAFKKGICLNRYKKVAFCKFK